MIARVLVDLRDVHARNDAADLHIRVRVLQRERRFLVGDDKVRRARACVVRLIRARVRGGVKVLGLSVDPLDSHQGWKQDIKDVTGAELNFPLIADTDHKIADLYDMLPAGAGTTLPEVLTVRSVYVVGPDNKVKLSLTYPASTGRNFDELLRVIDSLQLTAKHKVATPVDWKHGQDVIIVPSVSDADAKGMFPSGWKTVKPYLRVVPQPK